jgi:hypothetical protein
MSLDSMTPAEMKEQELKMRAKWAADTIIQAEAHKNDKELKKHLKNEFKERSKHLESAMGKEKAEKKPAKKKAAPMPAKKSAPKKKK